jgi:hypothetical protein
MTPIGSRFEFMKAVQVTVAVPVTGPGSGDAPGPCYWFSRFSDPAIAIRRLFGIDCVSVFVTQ